MKEKLQILKIIHIAICLGVIVLCSILIDTTNLSTLKLDLFSLIFISVPISFIFIGNQLYKSTLKNTDKSLSIEDKVPSYQQASIIRWAILEGAVFFCLIYSLIQQNNFSIIGILLISYIIYLRPSEYQMKKDFESIRLENR